MTESAKHFVKHSIIAPVIVALVVGIATGGMTAYATFNVFGYRLERAEKDILENRIAATARLDGLESKVDQLREAVSATRVDVSWIRGKLEGRQANAN